MATGAVSPRLDQAAIGLSLLCIVHCLALPLLLVLMPFLATLPIADERFHLALFFLVLPTSVAALWFGWRRHRRWSVMTWCLAGVGILGFAAVCGHDLLGKGGERVMTVIGALLVAAGHLVNFRLCRSRAHPD